MSDVAETIDLSLAARVRELEDRLDRERARNAGLTAGVEALAARVAALQEENARLREPRPRGAAPDRRRQPRAAA